MVSFAFVLLPLPNVDVLFVDALDDALSLRRVVDNPLPGVALLTVPPPPFAITGNIAKDEIITTTAKSFNSSCITHHSSEEFII